MHTQVGPRSPENRLTWRERIAAIRLVGPSFAVVWKAGSYLVIAIIALRAVQAFVPVASLWIAKLLLDGIVTCARQGCTDASPIWNLVGLEIGVVLLSDLMGRLNSFCDSLLRDRYGNLMSIRLMRHAAALDLSSFEDPIFYDKLRRAQAAASRPPVLSSFLSLCQSLVTLFSLSAAIVIFSPWLVLLLAGAVLPQALGEAHFSALSYLNERALTTLRRRLDYLRNIGLGGDSAKEVKSFGLNDYLVNEVDSLAKEIYLQNKALAIKRLIRGAALNLIAMASHYGAYLFILVRAIGGAISIGTFSFLVGAFQSARGNLSGVLGGVNDVAQQAIFMRDVADILAMRPSIASKPGALVAPRPIREGYEFRNVAFAYPGSDHMVFHNLNFRVNAGERIALVGENGAGKTTLVKLLVRLYDPTAGQILLDGVDLRDYNIEDLWRETGIIFQDYLRYSLPARHNIGFGKIDCLFNDDLIHSAAEKGLAKDVIARFADGYDQMLSRMFTGGVGLSGGEWQKFALSRAYMRDAQVLVLDEPTAAFDARAEFEVFQRFTELASGKTAVLISHRFSTVRMADRILVIERGEICEQGSHAQLLHLGGRYSELFHLQATGYR